MRGKRFKKVDPVNDRHLLQIPSRVILARFARLVRCHPFYHTIPTHSSIIFTVHPCRHIGVRLTVNITFFDRLKSRGGQITGRTVDCGMSKEEMDLEISRSHVIIIRFSSHGGSEIGEKTKQRRKKNVLSLFGRSLRHDSQMQAPTPHLSID
jgi:hypothetical protein